jgi:predicted AlkP superfamily pyrophosphatase or phosphodiesterase
MAQNYNNFIIQAFLYKNPYLFIHQYFCKKNGFIMGIKFLLGLFLLSTTAFSQVTAPSTHQQPELVVGIVVDQMRWDYLHRFESYFGEGGFKRMIREGFSYEQHYIDYAPSVTAIGHASTYTGSIPAFHGIVSNAWFDRLTEQKMYCVQDDAVQSVGGSRASGKMSPKNLLASTIGDELKIANGFQSRVFGIAIKDRGAILPAGRAGNGAFWFDDSTGNMISSTYYYQSLPLWVQKFNQRKVSDSLLNLGWNRLELANAIKGIPDEGKYKRPLTKEMKVVFPYDLKRKTKDNYRLIKYTPGGNTLVRMMAESLVLNENLGKQGVTDMLCVSFSSTDYLGHNYGPQSQEIADMYIRLDAELEQFFRFLDKQIGVGKYVVFLSADHGAPQTPQYLIDNKMSAGSVNFYDKKILASLDSMLAVKFHTTGLMLGFREFQFYLNNKRIDSIGLDRKAVYQTLIDYLMTRPEVLTAFSLRAQLNVILPEKYLEMHVRGYSPNRSGDVHVVLKPQFTDYLLTGTDHGSIFNYDTHIPMLWFGWKIPHGKSYRKTSITDVAPTLSALLNIQVPAAATGAVLTEIVR